MVQWPCFLRLSEFAQSGGGGRYMGGVGDGCRLSYVLWVAHVRSRAGKESVALEVCTVYAGWYSKWHVLGMERGMERGIERCWLA